MSQLIESIWIKNYKPINLHYHQARLNKTFRELFDQYAKWDLANEISKLTINHNDMKLRFIYDRNDFEIYLFPYERRILHKVKLVEANEISYDYKFIDRSHLEQLFSEKEDADEILIVKNNLITDANYFNVVIDFQGKLFTPTKPLLSGVMRQNYLDKAIIKPMNITIDDLLKSNHIYLINALNPLKGIEVQVLE